MADEDTAIIVRRADALIENHSSLLRALVALRKTHELSQSDVAERMGVSQPTVAGFERYDANPTLSTLRRYALAVGARIEESVIDDWAPPGRQGSSGPQTVWRGSSVSGWAAPAPIESGLGTHSVADWTPTPDRALVHA